MALRALNTGVSGWNNKTFFPKDRYSLVCLEEEFLVSKSKDNPMLKREWEIVAPEIVTSGDKNISVSGTKITTYTTTKVRTAKEERDKDPDAPEWDKASSDKAFGKFSEELVTCGFSPEEQVDDENPPVFMKGKTIDAIVYGKADVARKSRTPEQARKGIQADPILDADGNEIVTYQLQIEAILGLSTTQKSVAF